MTTFEVLSTIILLIVGILFLMEFRKRLNEVTDEAIRNIRQVKGSIRKLSNEGEKFLTDEEKLKRILAEGIRRGITSAINKKSDHNGT